MPVASCLGSNVDFSFICCYEEVVYQKDLSTLLERFHGQLLPEPGPLLVVLRRPSSHLYYVDSFDNWVCDYVLELTLRCHSWNIFAGWPNLELFAILPSHIRVILSRLRVRGDSWMGLVYFVSRPLWSPNTAPVAF